MLDYLDGILKEQIERYLHGKFFLTIYSANYTTPVQKTISFSKSETIW